MKMIRNLVTGVLAFCLAVSLLFAQDSEPCVVILSMDGFRWDYPDKCNTPNLNRIAANGVKAVSLQPAFPSKTFPNHYTMVTGLYPDHHGIVENEFYDPLTGQKFRINDRKALENSTFYEGEPIWVTAEKNGIKAASFFWVGSEAPIKGIQPTYWKRYNQGIPYIQRIDTVIYWLSLPGDKRPGLITWYMDEPDGIGHQAGPSDERTYRVVEYLDSLIGVFMKRMEALPSFPDINFIVTSDHGMGGTNREKTVYLKEYIKPEWFEHIEGYTPNLLFYVKEEYDSLAWEAVKNIPHTRAWKHGHVPEELHYGTNPRTGDFILVADSAWQLTLHDHAPSSGGAHGYSPFNTDMHAIFYATGPSFRKRHVHPVFENVNLYVLVCHLLHIEPAIHDGDIRIVTGMLKED